MGHNAFQGVSWQHPLGQQDTFANILTHGVGSNSTTFTNKQGNTPSNATITTSPDSFLPEGPNYVQSNYGSSNTAAAPSDSAWNFNGANSAYGNSYAEQQAINGLAQSNPNTNYNINAQQSPLGQAAGSNPYSNVPQGSAAQGMKTTAVGGKV